MIRLLCLLFLVAAPVLAADYGVFVADNATDALVHQHRIAGWDPATTNVLADYNDSGTNTLFRYTVVVTSNEYVAGWSALDPSKKAVAKAAAADARADMDTRMDKILKAFALVMLDEINNVRTNSAVLPARTTAQLKAAVKAKYQALP